MAIQPKGFLGGICPKCGSFLVGVEYAYDSPERYDGVSELVCIKICGYRVGRWSGKVLKDGEIEARYGIGSPVKLEKIDEDLHTKGEDTDSK